MATTGKKESFSSIARELGVSIAVVSNVIRNTSSTTLASVATRQKILRVAWEKGVRPNNNIGVVVPADVHQNESIFFPGFAGISACCTKLGFGVFHTCAEDTIPEFIANRNVSGVIFWNVVPEPLREFVESEMIPYLVMNPLDINGDYDFISNDDYVTMLELLYYLHEKDYRNFFLVHPNDKSVYSIRLKNAFNEFLNRTSTNGGLVLFNDQESNNQLIDNLERVISSSNRDTVLIAISRYHTVKVLEHLSALGKQIPNNLGFVGANTIARHYSPRLTSISSPFYEIGVAAVEMIAKKWKNRQLRLGERKWIKGRIIKTLSTRGE